MISRVLPVIEVVLRRHGLTVQKVIAQEMQESPSNDPSPTAVIEELLLSADLSSVTDSNPVAPQLPEDGMMRGTETPSANNNWDRPSNEELSGHEINNFVKNLREEISKSLLRRLCSYLKSNRKVLIAAQYLDVRYFRLNFDGSDLSGVVHTLCEIFGHKIGAFRELSLRSSQPTASTAADSEQASPSATFERKIAEMIRRQGLSSSVQVSPVSELLLLKSEIGRYDSRNVVEGSAADDDYPLKWWCNNAEDFPRLSFVARFFLSIQVSSVASERIWSDAGYVMDFRCASMNPGNFSTLIFLRGPVKQRAARVRESLSVHSSNSAQATERASMPWTTSTRFSTALQIPCYRPADSSYLLDW